MTGISAWNKFLRSRTAAGLALLSGFLVALLLLQAVVGWPFHRTLVLRLHPAEAQGAGVYRGHVPADVPTLDWNAPVVRVFADGVPMVQYKSVERMMGAPSPASFVKARAVFLRNPARPAPPARCEVRIPWLPTMTWAAVIVIVFLVLSSLLVWARNPWVMAWRARLARWPIATGLLGLLLAGSLAMRIAGLSFPSWENDSNDYFRPVFQWLSGLPITPTDRPLGYPAFIAAALGLFRDFRALLVLHMAASLYAGAVMAWVFFVCARRLFPPGGWRFLMQIAAILGTAYFLLNERVLEREWYLLPEALASAWLAGQLWLAWRLMTKPLSPRRALWEFAAFCFLGWLTFFTKSNWGFALGVLPLPLAVRALLRSSTRREFLRQCAAGAAVFAFVAALALGFQRLTPLNTLASVEIRSRVLVCWHLGLIRPEITRRLAENPPPDEAALLQEFAGLLDTEDAYSKVNGAGAYSTLGYDADHLYYIGFLRAFHYNKLGLAERAAFCRRLFFGALRHHPMVYVQKVARQWALYFIEPFAPARIQLPHVFASLERSETFLAHPRDYVPGDVREHYRPVVERARAELEGPWPTPPRLALSLRMQAATVFLNATFRWMLGLPMLLTLLAALWKPWRAAVPWLRLAPVLGLALWVTGSAAACALTSSVLQALEIQRYIDLFFPLTVLAQLLWPFIAIAILTRRTRRAIAHVSA